MKNYLLVWADHLLDWAEIWFGAPGQIVDLSYTNEGAAPFWGPFKGAFYKNLNITTSS